MEESPRPSMWERSTTRRFLRWLFSVRCLIALAWIVSLIALYYGIVDWRGHHAWNEFCQSDEGRIAPLDLQAYIPKPIPDSENFATTSFVQSWVKYGADYDTNFLFDRDAWGRAAKMAPELTQQPPARNYVDLVAWQEAFAAVRSHVEKRGDRFLTDKLDLASRTEAVPFILDGMKDDEAAFDELRAASVRPYARYPLVYDMENPWGILLPHLVKIKVACQRLQIKACAELAAGQNENALDDVKLILYLADTLKTEPCLISYLLRIACINIAIQPIWEGLAEHRWTDAQLQQLQARLESYDFLKDMQWPLHVERAMGILTVDLLKKKGLGMLADLHNLMADSSPSQSKRILNFIGQVVPSGWYDQEKLHYCQLYEAEFRGSVDEAARRVFPRQIAANASIRGTMTNGNDRIVSEIPLQGTWHAITQHEVIAAMLLPALVRVPIKAAKTQVATDQAAIACALERYRLANGQFPDDLQLLVPRFIAHLPNDVITGEPYKYRRTNDGRVVLYSIGWNEKDDGGVPGKTLFDESEGDWVWQYPAQKPLATDQHR